MTLGGSHSQSLLASDGHVIPLLFVNGLARLRLLPFTDDEWDNLPHVTMTHNTPWSPHRYESMEYMDGLTGPELRGFEDYPIAATMALYGLRILGSRWLGHIHNTTRGIS